jgi:hypothetical protein
MSRLFVIYSIDKRLGGGMQPCFFDLAEFCDLRYGAIITVSFNRARPSTTTVAARVSFAEGFLEPLPVVIHNSRVYGTWVASSFRF